MSTLEEGLTGEEGIHSLKEKSARGAVVTFGSQGLRFGINFGSQLVLAHLLVPAQFGIVAMASPVLGFISVFMDLGFSQATIQREKIDQHELSMLFWINVGLSLVMTAGLVLISPLVSRMYHEPKVGPVVIALALLLPLSGLTSQAMALLNRKMQFSALAMVELSAVSMGAVVAIFAAKMGVGYWALVIQQLTISLTTLLIVWPLSRWRPSAPSFDERIKPLLQFGGHLTTYNIVSYFTLYFDNILVGILNGPMALGLFERAFKLALQPLSQITAPIGRVAIPMLSRMVGSPAYVRAYIRMLQLVLLLALPGLLCAGVLSSELVLALLGPVWLGTAPILAYLSIAGALSLLTVGSCWLLVTQGRVREQMHCGFVSSGLILLSLLVGFHWGPVGIAAAYAIFAPVVHGNYVWVSTRVGPVKLGDVGMGLYPIAAAAAVSVLGLYGVRRALMVGPFEKVLVGLVVAYACSALALMCLPAGREMLRSIWALRSFLSKSSGGAAAVELG